MTPTTSKQGTIPTRIGPAPERQVVPRQAARHVPARQNQAREQVQQNAERIETRVIADNLVPAGNFLETTGKAALATAVGVGSAALVATTTVPIGQTAVLTTLANTQAAIFITQGTVAVKGVQVIATVIILSKMIFFYALLPIAVGTFLGREVWIASSRR